MKALARVPSAEGIGAMQSINVVVLNPSFLGAFIGTAVHSHRRLRSPPGGVLFQQVGVDERRPA